jgi:hypothetical protein
MSILTSTQEAVIAYYRREARKAVQEAESKLLSLLDEMDKVIVQNPDSIASEMRHPIAESRHALMKCNTDLSIAADKINNPEVRWLLRVDFKLGMSPVMISAITGKTNAKGREYEALIRSATAEIGESFLMGVDQFAMFDQIDYDSGWVDHTEEVAKSTFVIKKPLTRVLAKLLLDEINDMAGGNVVAVMENAEYGRIYSDINL